MAKKSWWSVAVRKVFRKNAENRKLLTSKDSNPSSFEPANGPVSTRPPPPPSSHLSSPPALTPEIGHGTYKSREEIAATKIQAAFRGYLQRKPLWRVVRLKPLVNGNAAKRQTIHAFERTKTMARVQLQIHFRRTRALQENQAIQKQMQLTHEMELEKLKVSEDWTDSPLSKAQIESNILNKHEAAIRRERTLAYAYSHQWRRSSRAVNPMFIDPRNPSWGWSWMERWMASRPSAIRSTTDPKDSCQDALSDQKPDHATGKSSTTSVSGEITEEHTSKDAVSDRASVVPHNSSNAPIRRSSSINTAKMPTVTARIKHPNKHSMAGSPARDDKSRPSLHSVPGRRQPSESARLKSRLRNSASDSADIHRVSTRSVKKQAKADMPSPSSS